MDELEGLAELVRNLEKMVDGVKPRVMAAFDRGLQGVVNHAKSNHPEEKISYENDLLQIRPL